MSSRVLFACWPFEGHVFPLVSIALAERARAGEVAFYTGRRLQATIESAPIEVFPFDRVEGAWTRVHEMERAVGAGRQSLRVQREAFRHWLVESIPDQVADLRAVIDRWRPDVLVTDGSMWGPSLILHETGPIPVALASTLLYALVPGPGAPPPGTRLGVPHSAATRALAWGAARATDALARGTRRRVDELRARHGLGPMGCSINELCGRLPLYLIGSVPELDFGRSDLPASVRYVGPLLWHPPEAPGTTAWLDRVPRDAPWVHVTEGTSQFQEPFLLRAAARGLAGAGFEALLTTGVERDPAALGLATARNVHVTRWLSHGQLLPRCDAVVTTGGANTIVAALSAGVPLVIVPTGWDKPENAKRVVAAGVGVRLAPRQCTPDRLRAAVEHVLADPSYRRRAAGIRQRLEAAPSPAGAAELIESLAAPAGQRPRAPRARSVA